jgi:hypothetical protein
MANETKTTFLDVSRGLGFGLLYHPVIGKIKTEHYPFVTRFRTYRPATAKKRL